jgi:hypothetical protein
MRACPIASSAAVPTRTPIRRTRSPCCARATSGHAAAPPSSVMNERRFTARMPPVLPAERIAQLGTADCCIHPLQAERDARGHAADNFFPRR